MQTPIFVFAAYMLGLIVFSILAGLAWSRFMSPLRELDSYVLEEPTPVIEYVAPATTAAMLKKAEARLRVHHDTDDLVPVAADRIRKFNDGVYEPMPVRTADGWVPSDSRFWRKEFTAADPTDDMPHTVVPEHIQFASHEHQSSVERLGYIHRLEVDCSPQPFIWQVPRPTAEPYDFEAYRRAREARLAIGEGDGLGEIWVLPAGGEFTEAQIHAVEKVIDAEGVKS